MTVCINCQSRPPRLGALCKDCLSITQNTNTLSPGCISCTISPSEDNVWLVDQWGRLLPLHSPTILGRATSDFSIKTPRVSRRHARIIKQQGSWTIQDLQSYNGTTVDGTPVVRSTALHHGAQLQLGDVRFLFVQGVLETPAPNPEDVSTLPNEHQEQGRVLQLSLRDHSIQLIELTHGGGGVLLVDGIQVQLALLQFALLYELLGQLRDDSRRHASIRGFIPSAELLSRIPWSTRYPQEDNLKQLVRRVRELLKETCLKLEGRKGHGYRVIVSAPST